MSTVATPPAAALEAPPPPTPKRRPWWLTPWLAIALAMIGAAVAAPWLAPYDPLLQLKDGLTPMGSPLPPSPA
ncbi:MAG: hypothetical protein ACLGIN_14180, partial [Candidatus Sericytochromatia bacterium]